LKAAWIFFGQQLVAQDEELFVLVTSGGGQRGLLLKGTPEEIKAAIKKAAAQPDPLP